MPEPKTKHLMLLLVQLTEGTACPLRLRPCFIKGLVLVSVASMPAPVLAVPLAVDARGRAERLFESGKVMGLCLSERVFQILCVQSITHPEVGVVMEKAAEDLIAVLGVCPRIKDMLVPHGVDSPSRNHALSVHLCQGKPTLVFEFGLIRLGLAPSFTFLFVGELHLDHFKVDGGDL